MDNLNKGRFSYVKGIIIRGVISFDYVYMVFLFVFFFMFDYFGAYNFGFDFIGKNFFMNLYILFY